MAETDITPSKPTDNAAEILYGDGPAVAEEPQNTPSQPAPPRAAEPNDEPAGLTFTADEVATYTQLLNGRQCLGAFDSAVAAKYGSANPDGLARQLVELEKTDKPRSQVLKSELREIFRARQQFEQQLLTADQQLKQSVTARQYDQVHKTEKAKLLAAAPDLVDPKVAEQFQRWLLSEGYSVEQIATTMSHRPLAHMFKLWRSQNQAPPAPRPAPVVKLRMPRKPGAEGVDTRSKLARAAEDIYGPARRRPTSTPKRDPRIEDPVSILYGGSR